MIHNILNLKEIGYDMTHRRNIYISATNRISLVGFFLYKADYWLNKGTKKFKNASSKTRSDVIRGILEVLTLGGSHNARSDTFKRTSLMQ